MESIPQFLTNMLINQYGEETVKEITEGYLKQRLTTFRVNTLKSSVEEVQNEMKKLNISYEKVSWSNEAFIVKNANEQYIEQLEIYKDGKIYMQSLSSMLPPIILEPRENFDILDMAAAPRWKNNTNCSFNKQ